MLDDLRYIRRARSPQPRALLAPRSAIELQASHLVLEVRLRIAMTLLSASWLDGSSMCAAQTSSRESSRVGNTEADLRPVLSRRALHLATPQVRLGAPSVGQMSQGAILRIVVMRLVQRLLQPQVSPIVRTHRASGLPASRFCDIAFPGTGALPFWRRCGGIQLSGTSRVARPHCQ